jgi:hypothetical protein
LGAATPSRLGDHGAVAFEFALIFPVLLLMFAGIFGIGVVMIEDMQLTFVAQQAANVEAANLGTGLGAQWSAGSAGGIVHLRRPDAVMPRTDQRGTGHRNVAH